MEHKQITVSDLVSENIEKDVMYTVVRTPRKKLKYKLGDFLKKHKLDSYSRSCNKNYRNGITNDLSYNDTLSKCSDKQFIKMIWVDGYSAFMEFKNKDEINKNVEHKVKKLLSDNKVGYIIDDSCGCYLACRIEDYKWLCNYLNVEYDKEDENKEYYYNSLFDDFREIFEESCGVIADIRVHMNERQYERFDKILYDVIRYVIVNIERYVDIIVSGREYNKDTKDKYWVNVLWSKAYQDYKNDK